MATSRQTSAARRNIKKAAAAARRQKTISRLPKKTRTALGTEGAKGGQAGSVAERSVSSGRGTI